MEMSEEIYDNDEIYVNENIVENPTTGNKQQPPNSGFITAWSWWHKLVLACLGLFCVFLLIVIIVLGVYISLNVEGEQLQKENNELLKKLIELQRECMYFNSSVYSIITEKKNWTKSRQDCIQRGADLVMIDSEHEQIFISRCFPNTQAWIGLNDIDKNGEWMWLDGTELVTGFWWNGDSYDYAENEDCVITGYTNSLLYNWDFSPCDNSVVGICEKKNGAP
ncbi:CD209 antigen-like protein E [Trichomycterus rosablanca]|uniref:CD209 antigen-like protein E n=1 Tax=Trichomycterus rosablanca TaxID=2290929 RepID=UPI002F356E1B